MVTELSNDMLNPAGDVEPLDEERAFMRAVHAGLADIEAGREVSLADVKTKLGFV
ncbi:MAG: hypothetical protein OXI22_09365 [Defluviicoccus sp.]|nr:hypothetical protein [Defluviicoccus sp.]